MTIYQDICIFIYIHVYQNMYICVQICRYVYISIPAKVLQLGTAKRSLDAETGHGDLTADYSSVGTASRKMPAPAYT